MKQNTLKQNLLFAAVILAAALALLGWQAWKRTRTAGLPLQAQLTYGDDSQTMIIPLDKDARYDVDTGLLTIHLEVTDGAIRFVDSPCPDHVCETYGYLTQVEAQAICMPARAWLVIVPAE